MSLRLAFALALFAAAPAVGAAEIVLDSPMDADPLLHFPKRIEELHPAYKKLWVEALSSPESELRMRAAEAIAKAAELKLIDMSDAARPLVRVLHEDDQGLPVRLAAAQALVAIGARESAGDLLRQAERDGPEMRQVAEPALAEWDDRPARAVWLKRLSAADTPHGPLVLAVRCLGTVRESAASERLRQIVGSSRAAAGVRVEAARALARIESAGLEELAETLASDPAPDRTLGRLLAATMLERHRGERAIALLKTLAVDGEPAVAAVALRWLLDADPALVYPFAGQVVRSPDAKVRRLGCESLFVAATPDAVTTLGPLLDDPHPDVRVYVRDSLFELASRPELDGPVREQGVRALNADGWRGPEQAAMLLGALDHEPAAGRAVTLLQHPRPEVMVASAWALRKLAVTDTLAPMLAHGRRQTEKIRGHEPVSGAYDQLSQIFQAFGEMNYREAEELMRGYVPKDITLGEESRAAAVWALGRLHAGAPDADLAAQLMKRLDDTMPAPPIPPEFERVRQMSAVTLGRMKAESALPMLRKYSTPTGSYGWVDGACNWAVTQLTGEQFPKAADVRGRVTDWFLVPVGLPEREGRPPG